MILFSVRCSELRHAFSYDVPYVKTFTAFSAVAVVALDSTDIIVGNEWISLHISDLP
jgi:hypothetical protein